jgi:hypothetical protein
MKFGSSDIPRGWVEAPEVVRNELELLWQEDEMPEELKQDPSYRPFTLSPDVQEWVDSMSEVRELSGKQPKVIGRPRPVEVREHRIVATPPPAPQSAPTPRTRTPSPHAPPSPPQDRPDYTRAEVEAIYQRVEEPPPKPVPPRPMPEIQEPQPERSPETSKQRASEETVKPARALPEIGEPRAKFDGRAQIPAAPRMPEIGGERREPERPRHVAAGKIPEIGQGKSRPKRQAYDPEKDEDDPILRLRGK